jgi:hypothetical protein
MGFSPSVEIHDRMVSELAGVYIDRAFNPPPDLWLVAKLPMNLIREIWVGAELSLMVWMVQVEDHLVLTFGLRVYDDKAAPFTTFGSCRSDAEVSDLLAVLVRGEFPLQIHNENFLPLFVAECRFDSGQAKAVTALSPSPTLPGEAGFKVRERANDAVEVVLAGNADLSVQASCELHLTLEKAEALKIHVIGSGDMSLDDKDEGAELERLTFLAFDALFPFGAFHSPKVGEGKDRRELCDVLGVARELEVGNEGIFVIQNKVAPAGLRRKTWRQGKSVQNQIMEGIGQLEGAINALRRGEAIYRDQAGTPIESDPQECVGKIPPLNLKVRAAEIGQGIVVISDMHHAVDWEAVFFELGKVFLSTRYYCHILDLKELARLVAHSKGRPALLEGLLLERGKRMLENKTAFVRFHFVGGKY